VSWFLAVPDREAFHGGACDLVPNNFSEVPRLLERSTKRSLVIAGVAPPDRHGYFSLGVGADYTASFIGKAPFFVEVNRRMPRTFGENQVHVSQVAGWCEADYPLVEMPPHEARATDGRIADLVAERIPHGATLQIGVGAIPDAVLSRLVDHRDLGVHTELFAQGFVDLIERGVITGVRKRTHRGKAVCTCVMGTQRLYDFVDENAGIELWPVDYTNDPRRVALEDAMVTVNAAMEVDFLGQCASESLGSRYYSSSGGQPDFARGAMFAENGKAFIVLHSTTADESVSRIVAQLHPGAAVTTMKNVVDHVVTEHGVAELRGSSIRERTRRLIAIAHPKFREDLERQGREMGYL
jgi:acyl-CoA hydrolase